MTNGYDALYLKAFLQFVEIWAGEEVGSSAEIDFVKVFKYLQSERFFFQEFENTKDLPEDKLYEIALKSVEQKVTGGFPIWEYLKVSPWTMNMLKVSFDKEAEAEFNANKKKYPCLTCRYFSLQHFTMGDLDKCSNKEKLAYWERVHRHERWHFRYESVRKCAQWEEKDGEKEKQN